MSELVDDCTFVDVSGLAWRVITGDAEEIDEGEEGSVRPCPEEDSEDDAVASEEFNVMSFP